MFRDGPLRYRPSEEIRYGTGCKAAVAKAIKYVASPVGPFGLRPDLRGTPFQQQVIREVLKIPFGQTSDYSSIAEAIAEAIGAPRAVRAVGSTCTHNWWAFAVPCHRVLHKGGGRRDTPQYRFADYEAKLAAKLTAR